MPAGKKKETKSTKEMPKATHSIDESIMTRLEVVEKLLLITRDEFKEVQSMLKRIKDRMGL